MSDVKDVKRRSIPPPGGHPYTRIFIAIAATIMTLMAAFSAVPGQTYGTMGSGNFYHTLSTCDYRGLGMVQTWIRNWTPVAENGSYSIQTNIGMDRLWNLSYSKVLVGWSYSWMQLVWEHPDFTNNYAVIQPMAQTFFNDSGFDTAYNGLFPPTAWGPSFKVNLFRHTDLYLVSSMYPGANQTTWNGALRSSVWTARMSVIGVNGSGVFLLYDWHVNAVWSHPVWPMSVYTVAVGDGGGDGVLFPPGTNLGIETYITNPIHTLDLSPIQGQLYCPPHSDQFNGYFQINSGTGEWSNLQYTYFYSTSFAQLYGESA